MMLSGVSASCRPKMTEPDTNNGSDARYMSLTINMRNALSGRERELR